MLNAQKLTTLLLRAFDGRTDLHADPRNTCYRLFNGEGDGIPGLCIDRYGDFLLVQLYESHLYDEIEAIKRSLDGVMARLPFNGTGILLKDRTMLDETADIAERRRSSLIIGARPPDEYIVVQNGMRAAADLMRGQNTGIFLDMREVRDALAAVYGDAGDILNLFSYTALFAVHALGNGVPRAVNVDLSRPFLRRARSNYELNGLVIDDRDFICGDSFEWVRRFARAGRRFGLVIFDPPTFSRNKRKTFSVRRNYRSSLAAIDGIAGRYVFTAVNAQSVTVPEYRGFHPPGWKPLFLMHEPADFRHAGAPYLKAGLWRAR